MQKTLTQLRSVAYFFLTLVMVLGPLGMVPSGIAGPEDVQVATIGDTIKIITSENQARLCPKPFCKQNQELLRIPANTKLKVEEVSNERLPMRDVVWYKISYKGKKGWVSEFDTDKAPKEPRYRR
jgi:hypothetical protein